MGLFAPSISALPDGSTVDIETNYPYEDEVQITVEAKTAMPLYIRIPGWAEGTVVNGKSDAENGTMYKYACTAGKNVVTVTFMPKLLIQRWGDLPEDGDTGPVSVHRGPLMFSLPISGNYTVLAHHCTLVVFYIYRSSNSQIGTVFLCSLDPPKLTRVVLSVHVRFSTDGGPNDSNDYQMVPTSDWQFALDVDMVNPDKTLVFQKHGYEAGTAPFNHSGWPVTVTATLRPLSGWGTNINSAAKPPASPACSETSKCGAAMQVELVPHGGTELRIGEFPQSGL